MALVYSTSARVRSYYNSLESRVGYRLFLGGTRHFGFYANESSWPFPISPALRRMEDVLLSALNVRAGERVLDAGCGVGHVAIHVAGKAGVSVEGVDITEHHLYKARRNIERAVREGGIAEEQVRVRYGDYHDLSMFEDGCFDAVYTMETLVHAVEPARALGEFLRVLKPGGTLCIHEYDHIPRGEVPDEFGLKMADGVHAVAPTVTFEMAEYDDYIGMFEDAGFVDVQQRDYSKNIVPMLWLFYVCALLPFWFMRLLGMETWFPNTVVAVTGYLYRRYWRLVQVAGRKPKPVS